ncbi:MAG TPA: PilN domain-containing protein [Verrucomicrobiae bacterium]|nr:PilN domain-containing protein [Verrucomicrobiae bacterium]
MVQFNLLPDVKLEYVKTQRTKNLLTLVSIVASVAGIAILLISVVTVDVVQKKSLDDENNDISRYSSQLKSIPNLNKILTVQNQLSTLTSLHDQKPVVSRLFGYIAEVTPTQTDLNELNIDFTANTITIGGSAPSLAAVSTYTDTLKATTYTISGSSSKSNAFSNIVLTSFGQNQSGATFTITCSFDPAIFNTNDDVALSVPQTASATQSVFQGGN